MTEFDRAVDALRRASSVVLACHVHPDGDALGSMLAVHHWCRHRGVHSVASWGEPFGVAPHYRFLPGIETVTPPEHVPPAPELMVVFDCGTLDRLGTLAPVAKEAGELAVLDHHPDNDRFGTINVVLPAAAATAVIVRRLGSALEWELDREVALCLYTGLVTDTGRFQHENTTPEVFDLAEELAAFDLPIPEVNRELFEKHRFACLQLMAHALATAEVDSERRFVATTVTAQDLARYGVHLDEVEGLIDLVRRTAEAEVSCVAKETAQGLRVSLRSVPGAAGRAVHVGELAARFGGGGHRFAAGFCSDRPAGDVLADLRHALDRAAP